MATPQLILVALSTALAAAATIPYIVATVRRVTVPRLVTWLTWALLTAVAGAASASVGDYPSAVFSLIGTLATGSVLVAGLGFGDRRITRLDGVCLLGVAVGFGLWQVLNLPGIAVGAACLIDFIGLVPTLVHSWRKPYEETMLTYALIAVAGGCAALAAWGNWTVTAMAYPAYVAVSMGTCWLILIGRRTRVARQPVPDTQADSDTQADPDTQADQVGSPGQLAAAPETP